MIRHALNFYIEGFRNMRLGRALWKIVLLKILFLFIVIKLFFFPDVLKVTYDNDTDRAEHVLRRLTQSAETDQEPLPPVAGKK